MKKTQPLRIKLNFMIIMIGAAGLIFSAALVGLHEYFNVRSEIIATMNSRINIAEKLTLSLVRQDAEYFRKVIKGAPPANYRKKLFSYLENKIFLYRAGDVYYVLDSHNTVVFVPYPYESFRDIDFSNFKHIINLDSVREVHQSVFTYKPAVSIAYEIGSGLKLIHEVSLDAIRDTFFELSTQSVYDDEQFFILTTDGVAAYHRSQSLVRARYNLRREMKGLESGDRSGVSRYVQRGVEYFSVKKVLVNPAGWVIYYAVPSEVIFSRAAGTAAITVFVFTSIFFMILLAIHYFLNRNFSDTISSLSAKLKSFNPDESENFDFEKTGIEEFDLVVGSINEMNSNIKKAREALERSEEIYRTVTEFSFDWAIWLSTENEVVYTSPACREVTGYDQDDFYNDSELVTKIIHQDDRDLWTKHREKIQTGRIDIEHIEFRILSKDGKEKWIHHVCKRVFDKEGTCKGYRGNNIDITERVSTEKELAKIDKLESLGTFAGGIAHDFNNLLSAILGNISLAAGKENLDNFTISKLKKAYSASVRAKHLTRQLLTYSKNGETSTEVMNLENLIRESCSFALRGSNIKSEINIDKNLHYVSVDGGQFSQVVNNLVRNARDAMPEGGVLIVNAVNVTPEEGGDVDLGGKPYIKISFTDEGPGVKRDIKEKIFDPYFSTKDTGSGLGLSVSHSIIRKHKGVLRLEESKDKLQTTFSVILPAVEEIVEGCAKEKVKITREKKFLIMDDDEDVREVLGSMIRAMGGEVDECESGEKAIELYKKTFSNGGKKYDIVILDLTVPGAMGGRETLKNLKKIDPEIKAICSSGYSDEMTAAMNKEEGFAAFIGKPYSLSELCSVIKSVR